jgi:SAM-dependent methyltransferase
MASSPALYAPKPTEYFGGVRRPFIDALPDSPTGRLLELGCGRGGTAAYALASGKCNYAAGIELCEEPAAEAATILHRVIVGDVEVTPLPFEDNYFDVLIASEVLEHLKDPWTVLRALHRVLKPGAFVVAGSPNVAHYSTIRMLLGGRWDLDAEGIMDRTHLRWFTPRSYAEMFRDCGFTVLNVGPAFPLRPKPRFANALTRGRFDYLLYTQIALTATRD